MTPGKAEDRDPADDEGGRGEQAERVAEVDAATLVSRNKVFVPAQAR